jgi:HAD superfamily hydrolase (TIGR01484 family)
VRYHVLITDYDQTIADHGVVLPRTMQALEKLRASGRHLVLVTGRELDDLIRIFPRIDLFDRVVVENGGLLYRPESREQRLLADPPPAEFVQALRDAGVYPLSVGKVIVATLRPNESQVLAIIRDLGLELEIIFNRTGVMILPPGIDKASGAQAALLELGLSIHSSVGVGDAENDQAFLSAAGCSIAVANALDALKKCVDHVTKGESGEGIVELTEQLLDSDLSFLDPISRRRGERYGDSGEDSHE